MARAAGVHETATRFAHDPFRLEYTSCSSSHRMFAFFEQKAGLPCQNEGLCFKVTNQLATQPIHLSRRPTWIRSIPEFFSEPEYSYCPGDV